VFTPLILPGLFTASAAQSPLPVDRVSFDYGHYNKVAVMGVGSSAPMLVRTTPRTVTGTVITQPVTSVKQDRRPVAGFNLNTFNFGVEKTFLDGIASAYVSVPLLYATDNISGQQINGLGDVNAGFKVILYQNLQTGSTLSGGFTASFPTAHAAISSSYLQSQNGTGDTLLTSSSSSVNPTFLQPWLAALLRSDRLYIREYFGIIVPTDDRVATFLNNDLSVGYSLYLSNGGRFLSSVTPTVGAQLLIPLNHAGIPAGQGDTAFVPFNAGSLPIPPPPSSFSFTDQVFLMGGLQLGLGERWMFSANVVVPVAGPRGYSVGATFGLNYFY
jgi:hypothetical protein